MGDGGADAAVDVCVCTFRRASLRRTIESLAAQQDAPAFRIIVADNDETPSAQALVEKARGDLGLDITYVHAPARNISIARNACLDAARAPLVAFIDDDEIAPPRWLMTLANGLGDHDIVFGPVRAIYAADAPRWVVRGDFHSFGPVVRAHGVIDTGYSSNVLMRREVVGAVRFEPGLGRTGGEDTFFFARLHRAGTQLGACAEAFVEEPTAPERARLSWLVRRAFRAGQTHARVLHDRGQGALAIAVPAAAKVLYCTVALVLTLLSPAGWRRNAIRAALHCGVIAKALGARDLELYR
jgi:succinoglycan biosynthesis protein ExoM